MSKQILFSLLNSSWQWVLLAATAGLLIFWLRRRRRDHINYVFHQLCLLSLVSLPILFALNQFVPSISIGSGQEEIFLDPQANDTKVGSAGNDLEPLAEPTEMRRKGDLSVSKRPLLINRLTMALVGIWLVGALLMFVRLLTGLEYLRRLRRSAHPAGSNYLAICRRICRKMDLEKSVQVLVSSQVTGPISYGWLSPVVLVPPSMASEEFELAAVHELAHIKRLDWLTNLFSQLVGVIFYFHPVYHLLNRQLVSLREHLCDQWVVELSGDKERYAQYLLDQFRGQKQRYTLALGLNQSSKLEKRIKNILLTENLSDWHRRSWRIASALLLVSLPLLATAQLIPIKTVHLSLFSPSKTPVADETNNPDLPSEEFDGLKPPANSIWSAAAEGDLKTAREHLSKGIDINARDSSNFGITPLAFAILQDQTQMAKFLIHQGADVNAKYGDEDTALHYAAFLGQYEVAELLVQKGADVNAEDEEGKTPIFSTMVDWGTTKFIAGILQLKLDRERVETGRAKIVELLHQHGAQTDFAGPVGNDIWAAAGTGNIEAVKQHLAKGVDINARDKEGSMPPLSWAALSDQTKMAGFLIQRGADINIKHQDGGTALHNAAFLGRYKTAELLIQKGADVNARMNNGATAMDVLKADWETTQFIAQLLQIQVDREKVKAGRGKIAKLLRHFPDQGEIDLLRWIETRHQLPVTYQPNLALNRRQHAKLHQAYVDHRLEETDHHQRERIGWLWKQRQLIQPKIKNRGASFVKIMEYVIEVEPWLERLWESEAWKRHEQFKSDKFIGAPTHAQRAIKEFACSLPHLRYERAAEIVEARYDRGRLSGQQAKKRMQALKRQRQFEEMEVRVIDAYERGAITRQQAEQRLIDYKENLLEAEPKDKDGKDRA